MIDQLARHVGPLDPRAVRIDQLEPPAGDRPAHAAAFGQGQLRRQIGHPGGRFGLPIHHDETPARCIGELGEFPVQFGREFAAGLGHRLQRRQLHAKNAQFFQNLVGVGHAAERSGSLRLEKTPEFPLHEPPVRQQKGCAYKQMAVHDGQAVRVAHRQGRDRALVGRQFKIGGDRFGVGADIAIALTDQFRTPRRSGSGQQQSQLIEQIGRTKAGCQQRIPVMFRDGFAAEALGRGGRNPKKSRAIGGDQLGNGVRRRVRRQQRRHDSMLEKSDIARQGADRVRAQLENQ